MTGTDVVHHLSAALFVPVLSGFKGVERDGPPRHSKQSLAEAGSMEKEATGTVRENEGHMGLLCPAKETGRSGSICLTFW